MREPDLIQRYTHHADWKAWRIPPPKDKPKTSLGTWLIEAPGIAPAWTHYLLGVAVLRDVEGVEPALLQYTDADYELLLCAINPGKDGKFVPDPDSPPWKTLRPVTLALQFGGVSDFQAKTILDLFAEQVVKGQLSPEPGGVNLPGISKEAWRQALAATLACMSEGKHTDEEG